MLTFRFHLEPVLPRVTQPLFMPERNFAEEVKTNFVLEEHNFCCSGHEAKWCRKSAVVLSSVLPRSTAHSGESTVTLSSAETLPRATSLRVHQIKYS